MTVGVLAAFLLYLRRFFAPMEELSAVLQPVPGRGGRAREAVGRARRGAERRRARRADAAPARARRAAASKACASPTATASCCTTSTSRSRPGRRSRSSAPPAPARRRSPGSRPGSGTRPKGACCSTASTNATSREADLRRAIVTVTQENFLFSGSVLDNIGSAIPARPDAEIEAAATRDRRARVHRRPARTATTPTCTRRAHGCRRDSASSSSFARAFLADPAVLILDEATSSLDVPSERLVQRALADAARRPHRDHHRPPPDDRGDRRSRHRRRRRSRGRGRCTPRSHRRHRPLRRPPPGLGREPRLTAPCPDETEGLKPLCESCELRTKPSLCGYTRFDRKPGRRRCGLLSNCRTDSSATC